MSDRTNNSNELRLKSETDVPSKTGPFRSRTKNEKCVNEKDMISKMVAQSNPAPGTVESIFGSKTDNMHVGKLKNRFNI